MPIGSIFGKDLILMILCTSRNLAIDSDQNKVSACLELNRFIWWGLSRIIVLPTKIEWNDGKEP